MEFGSEDVHAVAGRGRGPRRRPGSAEDSDSPATYRVRQSIIYLSCQ